MPTDKDFKRLVRGRMHKTGESYTAARAQLRKQKSVTISFIKLFIALVLIRNGA